MGLSVRVGYECIEESAQALALRNHRSKPNLRDRVLARTAYDVAALALEDWADGDLKNDLAKMFDKNFKIAARMCRE